MALLVDVERIWGTVRSSAPDELVYINSVKLFARYSTKCHIYGIMLSGIGA